VQTDGHRQRAVPDGPTDIYTSHYWTGRSHKKYSAKNRHDVPSSRHVSPLDVASTQR